jgi:single-stranded DNA-binding protein
LRSVYSLAHRFDALQASPSRPVTARSTTGEWQDVNDGFFRCTAWRSVAENTSRTLKKGMRVFVAGKLVQRTWQDNDGNKLRGAEKKFTA